ncbi:MAG: hypothetical protein HRT88_21490, partial [Lentisphaeraceae bacterium]|nr:hypothetical protein [Lentisphaeraceae bacterium]
ISGNERRVLRALEAVTLTGEALPGKTTWGDTAIIPGLQVVNMCTADLNRSRIRKRTAIMLESGWLEETQRLTDQGLFDTPTAFQSLGYKQINDYNNGNFGTFEELTEKVITLTCRYAKRQRTWFRNQHQGSVRIDREEGDCPIKISQHIKELWLQHKDNSQ